MFDFGWHNTSEGHIQYYPDHYISKIHVPNPVLGMALQVGTRI